MNKSEIAEQIVEYVRRNHNSRSDKLMELIAAYDEERAIAESRSQWIPVEEKLPDTTDSYLVWVRGIGDDGEMFQESVEAVFSRDRNHWTAQHGWLSHEVQGWMPMPQPPKGNKNV